MIYVFLIVNTKSGGGSGNELLQLGFNYLSLKASAFTAYRRPASQSSPSANSPPATEGVKLVIDSIQKRHDKAKATATVLGDEDPTYNKAIFTLIGRVVDLKKTTPQSCRIMVAGGDGTLMWCIQCLRKHGINLSSVSVGIVPFGTGNDFARAVGCIRGPPMPSTTAASSAKDPSGVLRKAKDESYIDMMTRLLSIWLSLTPEPIDLWNVKISLRPNSGAFHKIDSQTRKKRKMLKRRPPQQCIDDNAAGADRKAASRVKEDLTVTELDLCMSNYFSIGIESRIGIGFDRNRTSYHLLNRLAYVFEGFKKLLFHKTNHITTFLNSIDNKLSQSQKRWTTLCVTERHAQNAHLPLLAPCVSLIFLNIPSFAGGLNVWGGAQGKLGLLKPTGVDQLAEASQDWSMLLKNSCYGNQSIGDRKLEIISFKSLIELSLSNLERFMHAPSLSGWRVSQVGSVTRLNFNKSRGRSRRIYFQVDGEFFIATDIQDIVISHDSMFYALTNRHSL